jgi:glycine/D-amino acid oxidase-like deaminating enzyme
VERRTEVLIVGGGLGGVAAALGATRRGARVILTEETHWLGGALTSQGVPPDEHPWIEERGCSASYRALRDGIRAYYRAHFPLTAAARARPHLNPGSGTVSALCHEPRAAVAVIEAMLARRVEVLRRQRPVAGHVDGDRVVAVTFENGTTIAADWFVDATETGELLALCAVEHVSGAESRTETGEPHAAERADPLNMQPVSVCFALDHVEGEDHTIERPAEYERFAAQFSLVAPDPQTGAPVQRTLRPNPPGDPALVGPDFSNPELDKDLWLFRRIAARGNFAPGAYPSDIALVNWPQIDYAAGPIFGVPDAAEHRAAARQLSLSFLHWLQTEAGWPGLRLRGDVLGDTPDGLAMAPYVRESRRIRAQQTIREQEVGMHYADTVGVGYYRIDLHPSTAGDPYLDIACDPYELPLGALLPIRVSNLLPGAKNIGTTHITNGTYRVHPVEWNVGEVAGHLAAFCAAQRVPPAAVREGAELLAAFQAELTRAGVELRWAQ